MAGTLPMAPQRTSGQHGSTNQGSVRRPTVQTAAGHPGTAYHAPHGGRQPAPRHVHTLAIMTVLTLVVTVAAAAWWLWLPGMSSPKSDPLETLMQQMQDATAGVIAPVHAFGGTLAVVRGNGRTNVVAGDLPSKACVQAGWRLAKSGTVIVNGVLPARLSAARLSELCAGTSAVLTWVPDE